MKATKTKKQIISQAKSLLEKMKNLFEDAGSSKDSNVRDSFRAYLHGSEYQTAIELLEAFSKSIK